MFSRRSIQGSLDHLAGSLSGTQIEQLVRRLQSTTLRELVATEWEIMVMAAIARCSQFHYEQDLGGTSRPDIQAKCEERDLEFVADICTVSDADMEDENPVELFRQLIRMSARDLGLTGAGLFTYVDSVEVTDKKQRELLALPPKGELARFVDTDVRPFLNVISANDSRDHEFRYEKGGTRFTLKYKSTEKVISGGGSPTYTWPRTPTHNPLYRALDEKSDQLRKSGFAGLKGIVVCDGGCEAVATSFDQIVATFFRKHRKTVSFVAGLDIPEGPSVARTRISLRPRLRLQWNPYRLDDRSQRVATFLEGIAATMPLASGASKYRRNRSAKPDLLHHNSLEGAFMIDSLCSNGPTQVRISARAALQVLAGDLRVRSTGQCSVPVEFFQAQLAAGRTIRSIRIERLEDDDDDWLVIELAADPAISAFSATSMNGSSP